MNNLKSIIKFTMSENMKKKSYKITTIIFVIISFLAVALPTIIEEFKGDDEKKSINQDIKEVNMYYINNKALQDGNIEIIENAYSNIKFVEKKSNEKNEILKEIEKNENESLIVFKNNDGLIEFDLYQKSGFFSFEANTLGVLVQKLNSQNLLSEYNISDENISKIIQDVNYTVIEVGDKGLKNLTPSMLLMMLTFFAIYFFGYGVATSVTSEKTSRVMEILVTSTKPSLIVTGKCIGMGLLGFFQMILVILSGVISFKLIGEKSSVTSSFMDFSALSPKILLFNLIFFILGYSFYSMLNAMCAATVSKAEDINAALVPVNLLAFIGLYFGMYGTMYLPDSNVAIIASILPISSPFSMPLRLNISNVPIWHIVTSIVLLIVFTFISVRLSIRFYSLAILHYGARLKLSSLFKMKL